MEWIQLFNPFFNQDKTNAHATCISCPYHSDFLPDGTPAFYGLLFDGKGQLLDASASGNYLQIGAYDYPAGSSIPGMHGPQLNNDAGVPEFPTVVELYIQPDPSGTSCIDCKACFDPDGAVRMASWPMPDGSVGTFQAPACPAYCLDNVSPPPRASSILSAPQLVVLSEGLTERPCEEIITYDTLKNRNMTSTICEGLPTKVVDSVPTGIAFGRVGGTIVQGFFVAPTTANYTFNGFFDDGGELWLSPNADPRSAIPELRVSPGHDSKSDGSSTSQLCGEWKCVGVRCFRPFGARVTYDNAAKTCASVGGLLAAPRNSAESTLIKSFFATTLGFGEPAWIGIDARGKTYSFKYSNGAYAGFANSNTGQYYDWTYSNFHYGEPNNWGHSEV